jgi:hypothetical protein
MSLETNKKGGLNAAGLYYMKLAFHLKYLSGKVERGIKI